MAVVVIAVGIAAFVCVVLGWFAALVIGRAPEFDADHRDGLPADDAPVRVVRVPPHRPVPAVRRRGGPRVPGPPCRPPGHPAAPRRRPLPPDPGDPGRHRRAHRGARRVRRGIFAWLVALVTGWLPKPVHEAFAAFIRYELRLIAYLGLLVPTYPGEVFGDLAPPVAGPRPRWRPVRVLSRRVGCRSAAPAAPPPPPAAVDARPEHGGEEVARRRHRARRGRGHRPRGAQRVHREPRQPGAGQQPAGRQPRSVHHDGEQLRKRAVPRARRCGAVRPARVLRERHRELQPRRGQPGAHRSGHHGGAERASV